MNEKIVNIAFTLASNRGAYAILLGSGVSKGAGIPTGWEITLDLIKKFAQMKDGVATSNPEEWYRTNYNKEPDYSEVLHRIYKTPTERSRAIKGYIEKKNIETGEYLQVEPTKAHRAIARLVQLGIIKVIITTNFDRLMENALAELQITPQVITNGDSLKGCTPIGHEGSTLIKVNGDYLDTRSKNTKAELSQYNRSLKKLLTNIVNDYGLIVCGWSGEWDEGLVNSLRAKSSRRYWMYWANLSTEPSENANRIINHQRADLITNITADEFFENLSDSVAAIIDSKQTRPASIQIAIELTKKYLPESKYSIKLNDLIMSETSELVNSITAQGYKHNVPYTKEEFMRRVAFYETKCEILLNILITCAYFGDDKTNELIRKSVNHLLNSIKMGDGYDEYLQLAKYPVLFIMYPVLISSLSNDKTQLFKKILVDCTCKFRHSKESCVFEINPLKVLKRTAGYWLTGQNSQSQSFVSLYLINRLFIYLKPFMLTQNQYEEVFDKMEYYLALIYISVHKNSENYFWVPLGSFFWQKRSYSNENSIQNIVTTEIETLKSEHPLLKARLFNSSYEELSSDNQRLVNYINDLPWF